MVEAVTLEHFSEVTAFDRCTFITQSVAQYFTVK